jgi:hypothetical protein
VDILQESLLSNLNLTGQRSSPPCCKMCMWFCLRFCSCCLSPRTIRRAKQQQEVADFKNAKITITKIEKVEKVKKPNQSAPTVEQVDAAFTAIGVMMDKMAPAIQRAHVEIPNSNNVAKTVEAMAPTVVESVAAASITGGAPASQ